MKPVRTVSVVTEAEPGETTDVTDPRLLKSVAKRPQTAKNAEVTPVTAAL